MCALVYDQSVSTRRTATCMSDVVDDGVYGGLAGRAARTRLLVSRRLQHPARPEHRLPCTKKRSA